MSSLKAKHKEVGLQAVWSLSSCKLGYGVSHVRDNDLDTYWQSDGPQPHLISVEFYRKTTITGVAIYVDYSLDESYTPSKVAFKAGSSHDDLQQVTVQDLEEPQGWVNIYTSEGVSPVRAYVLQIAILSNHQNGRDTHIRQVKLYGPELQQTSKPQNSQPIFSTIEFRSLAKHRTHVLQ